MRSTRSGNVIVQTCSVYSTTNIREIRPDWRRVPASTNIFSTAHETVGESDEHGVKQRERKERERESDASTNFSCVCQIVSRQPLFARARVLGNVVSLSRVSRLREDFFPRKKLRMVDKPDRRILFLYFRSAGMIVYEVYDGTRKYGSKHGKREI